MLPINKYSKKPIVDDDDDDGTIHLYGKCNNLQLLGHALHECITIPQSKAAKDVVMALMYVT